MTSGPTLTPPVDDSGFEQTFSAPQGYGELSDVLNWIASDMPQLYPNEQRIQGWIDELENGTGLGRDDNRIRDDIVKHILAPSFAEMGMSQEQIDDLIKGANDGGVNLGSIDISQYTGGGGSGGGGTPPAGDSSPQGVMAGGDVFRIAGTDIYGLRYMVGDIEHLYTFDSRDSAVAVLGPDFADQGLTVIQESDINDGDTWLLGGAEAFAGGEGTYDQFFGQIMDEAALEAGIRDPNRLARVYQDPTVQRILAEGAQGDWSDARIQAEIRNTDVYYDIYPGIDKILASGSVDPEAEWRSYYNAVEDGLRVLGYEADEFGNYDAHVGEMLEKGIDTDDFAAFVPTFVRAEQSPEFMASLNAWTQNDLGVDVTFEDWFDVLDGNPAPEIGEVVEKAIIQYQADRASTTLSPDQITRLATLTELQEGQIAQAFNAAEEQLLSVSGADLTRFGLSEAALVNAAFGVETLGPDPLSSDNAPLSAGEVRKRARKAATELGVADDFKQGFFLGFDRHNRPQRTGLAAGRPESG